MDFTEEHKKQLEHQLVETIIQGLEKEEIDIHDLHPIADAILKKIDLLESKEQANNFVKQLGHQWHIFNSLKQ